MKIENQVCALEQAKRLKELGVSQDSYFHYGDHLEGIAETWMHEGNEDTFYSAYTVAELGVMLPATIEGYQLRQWTIPYTIGLGNISYGMQYRLVPNKIIEVIPQQPVYGQTEAEARAKLLIAIIEGEKAKVEEVNQRLQAAG